MRPILAQANNNGPDAERVASFSAIGVVCMPPAVFFQLGFARSGMRCPKGAKWRP